MLIVHVDVRVVPDLVEDFLRATQANAAASLVTAKKGVIRAMPGEDEVAALAEGRFF